jgi:hypothetical protein
MSLLLFTLFFLSIFILHYAAWWRLRFGFTLGAGSLGKILGNGRMNLYGVACIFTVTHLSTAVLVNA